MDSIKSPLCKRIAVMTSGGDSPGMNGATRAVIRTVLNEGREAYAVYEGYQGLVEGGELIKRLEWADVRGWLSEGGTLIGTARCQEFRERPGRLKAAKNMIDYGINALVICGGDGSLTGADTFRAEWPSILEELASAKSISKQQREEFKYLNIVGLVGSIDNDFACDINLDQGAHDRKLNKISPSKVKDILANDLKLDTRITTLGHVQRGGHPCAYDRLLSTLQGVEAVKTVLVTKPGDPSQFVAIIENKIVRKPLLEAVASTQAVAKAISERNFEKAADLRGPEFAEYHDAYGGSEIGTNRDLPSKVGIQATAECFKLWKFDALFIIGGFEAFTALSELRVAREKFPSFRIPMALLPATISNNVPGTEYSVGSDTCLNALVGYCDAIRQSASASRRRIFVVETQGGRSGYIATMAGLAVGALAVYTPEEGIDLPMLSRDIQHLRESFATDKGQNRAGKLILNSEHASATFTTQVIADIIKEESRGRFESRFAIPGHVQQGGTPSPMDRVRAVRLAVKCIRKLESYVGKSPEEIMADDESMAVIGIRGASVVFESMKSLEAQDTNWKDRRPASESWLMYKEIVDALSNRPKPDECCSQCGKKKTDLSGMVHMVT
ncbi:6-phosphofructokinase, alpha subunit [Lecanora helva]